MPEAYDYEAGAAEALPAAQGEGLVGRRLGPYEILQEIGQGGMSVVYRGRDTRLNREVAVKVLHPFLADREDARHRFQREALAVAKLHHPNILEIYDFSAEATKQSYIVMELVLGDTLRDFADKVTLQPPEVAALIGIKICNALEQAHELGIVHRDVKPENVMLDREGALKLMDFGIAHMRDATSLTITGTILGSPAHMAPEAIEGGTVDEKADQFSLGTILYWMATGKLPFIGKNPHALLKKIGEGRFAAPQRINPKISDSFANVICRSLSNRPEQRFSCIGDLRDALLDVLRQSGITDVDETLVRFYKEPKRTSAVITATAVNAYTQQALERKKHGETAQALAALNQVLALDPENSTARVELEAITKSQEQASLKQSLVRAALVVAAIAAVAVAVFWFFPSGPTTENTNEKTGKDPVLQSLATQPGNPQPGNRSTSKTEDESLASDTVSLAGTEPRAGTEPKEKRPPLIVTKLPVPERAAKTPFGKVGKRKGLAKLTTKKEEPKKVATTAGDQLPDQRVVIRVDPWADIFVNDERRVKGAKIATLTLAPGRYQVRFENRYAAPVTRDLEVRANGTTPTLSVKLEKMKPAYLFVQATPDADINVAGTYKGPASASQRTPIVIPMPDRVAEARYLVQISKPGYQDFVIQQRFVPGETLRLRVNLKPDQATPAKSSGKQPSPSQPAPRQ